MAGAAAKDSFGASEKADEVLSCRLCPSGVATEDSFGSSEKADVIVSSEGGRSVAPAGAAKSAASTREYPGTFDMADSTKIAERIIVKGAATSWSPRP